MEPNQTPVQPPLPVQPVPPKPISEQKSELKKSFPLKWLLVITGIILVAILLIGIYMLSKNQSVNQKPAQKTTQTPTPIKKPNTLNPNTGNLYSDIKLRLNEVLK